MPYSVKGFLVVLEDMVQILFMMEVLFTQDSKVEEMGPVVQSIVSLTSSLRAQLVKIYTTL